MNRLFQHVIALTVLSVALLTTGNILSAAETNIVQKKDFVGVLHEIIDVKKFQNHDIMIVNQDTNSAVYQIVLQKGGGVVMAEVLYEKAYPDGTRRISMAEVSNVMQRSVNAPEIKRLGREIFIVGLSEKLADGDEWKGKIYRCGMFEVYTGQPSMQMYATIKELAIEILQKQTKQTLLLTESKEEVAEPPAKPPVTSNKVSTSVAPYLPPPQGMKNTDNIHKKHRKLGE